MGANSTGCPARPMGVFSPNFTTFSAGIVLGMSGVQTGPGATELTRTPFLIASSARALVNVTMAPLVVA